MKKYKIRWFMTIILKENKKLGQCHKYGQYPVVSLPTLLISTIAPVEGVLCGATLGCRARLRALMCQEKREDCKGATDLLIQPRVHCGSDG